MLLKKFITYITSTITTSTMAGSFEVQPGDSLNYWAAYLADAEPCRFPPFDVDIDGPKRPLSVRVQPDQIQELQKLAGEDGEILSSVLRTAWALLLRCYTGLEDVSFGYRETKRNMSVDGTCQGTETPVGLPIARMRLEDSASLLDLVKKAQDDFARAAPYQHEMPAEVSRGLHSSERRFFNTAVLLRHYSNLPSSDEEVISTQPISLASFEEVSLCHPPSGGASCSRVQFLICVTVRHSSSRQRRGGRPQLFSRVGGLRFIDGASFECGEYV